MTSYDTQLKRLQQQVMRKKQLESMQRELNEQKRTWLEKVKALEAIKIEEQEDVDQLEGHSLAAFFYNVVGKREEKLTQERQEAYAARVKYEAARRELAVVEEELRRREEELAQLRDCESQYQYVLQEKAEAIEQAGGQIAEEIFHLEQQCMDLDGQREELQEAIAAGQLALKIAEGILSSLDSAEGWATLDLFGGGLLSDLSKYSHLDEAQEAVEQLQEQLGKFKTELVDVRLSADLQINVDGFLQFADYFFDGLFVDWMVMDQIGQAQGQIQRIKDQIQAVLAELDILAEKAQLERAQKEKEREKLICSATC
ncbi:MAG: hypothetical protein ACOX7N_05930 [Lawsonibacter sp.]|jgi:hypothetical protein